MLFQSKDTLLLVGNAASDRANLRTIFSDAYHLLEAENTAQGIMLLNQNRACITAVLADLPTESRDNISQLIAETLPGTDTEIPVMLFMESTGRGANEDDAFLLGATSVVFKPYSVLSVRRRVKVMVDLFQQRWNLKKVVEEQSIAIFHSNQVMLDALSTIIEQRSNESGNHSLRIRQYTEILLREVARCCPEYGLTNAAIVSIASASTLHDIGKIAIPDVILNKPGRLTPEERAVMETHTTIGGQMIEQMSGVGDITFMRYAYHIALYHHERWNGRGYPKGLSGDDIPICAQVVGVADVFDALTSERVYKSAFSCEVASNMILNGKCGAFSPKLMECFKRVYPDFVALHHRYDDGCSPKGEDVSLPLPKPTAQTYALDSSQLSQAKYQSMLHYISDTVVELDMDNQLYHVVYNPDPDFVVQQEKISFHDLLERLVRVGLHPEGMDDEDALRDRFREELFHRNMQRYRFSCWTAPTSQRDSTPYDVSLLRVNTENEQQHIMLVVIHKKEDASVKGRAPERTRLSGKHGLHTLTSCVLRCRMDAPMTIDQGARNLYYLTGYSSEEIADQFNNSLFGLLPPEDRHILSEMCRNCVQFGAKTEAEFRIMRNNGKQLTVLCKGLVCPEDDGTEYYYLTLTDVSYCIAQQKRREDIDLRNQLIVDQMDGVVFEWNLVNDMVTCSDKWQARFGYAPISDRFSTKLETATHFHPDDLIVLREQIQAVYNGASSVDKEVRIANQEGKYLWNRITASVLRRDDGVPVRIVGLITDINDRKTADLSLKQQAERDSLTGLYNKASGKKLIGDYLDQRKSAGLSAMMILDLDNFKTVNDNYGHLYGDALLTQVSTMLRGLFRAQDIIARIGGDEFLVLLKDIPSEDVLCARCDLLLNTSREMLHKLMPDLDVSCSVGCVLIPEHGTTYRALFKKADAALYVAKARGKNQYKIYDAQDQNSTLRVAPRTTRVDSDEDNSNTDETFARFVFHRLYESRNIDATISELLAFVGARYNVSRAYIFENNDDNTACSNTFEWCNVGIAPAMYSLQNLSYTTDLPGWPKLYDERGMFYCTDISTLPPEYREILEPQGIKSMLQCAIMDAGVFRGYVGFDECTSNRLWTQGQVSTLEFLAEVLAIFLIKQRTQNWSTHNLPPQKNAS